MPLESLLPAAFEYGCGFLWGRLGVHLVWVWTVGLKAQVRAGGQERDAIATNNKPSDILIHFIAPHYFVS
jgi:hypothetical protein